jgi:SET domain-containing protein
MLDLEKLAELFYVAESGIHGLGLFSRNAIEPGTYLGTYDGPETEINDTYVLWMLVDEETDTWIGRDGQNLLRYLNHSDNPCAEFTGFDLYATEFIPADREITIDYGEDPAAEPAEL